MREGKKHSQTKAPLAALWRAHAIDAATTRHVHPDAFIRQRSQRQPPWPRPAADAFDYSAINLHMAKQLVKDLLEAFDAEGNRSRGWPGR